jgi:hypothetical protein
MIELLAAAKGLLEMLVPYDGMLELLAPSIGFLQLLHAVVCHKFWLPRSLY